MKAWKTIVLCLILIFFWGGCSEPPGPVEEPEPLPPNILIILADDAGYADFGFQGETDLSTPNIDRLASRGVVFSDAHVTATVCSPSRAGLLTGRYQQRFGYESNSPPPDQGLDGAERTLASLLKERGYRTGLFGKWHLGLQEEHHPNSRGFDEFYGFLGGSRSYFSSPLQDRPGSPRAIMHNREYVSFEGYLTDVLAERAASFIGESSGQPFFAFLSFNAVHTPMEAAREDMNRFIGHKRQILAAMTWSMDRAVGTVIDKLEEMGITENTLVFFLSDNGGAAFNNSRNTPLKGWKGNKFEGGHRIPFLISWPGRIEEGVTFTGLTSSLDIVPTALARAIPGGAELPSGLDGVDLLPFLAGEREDDPHECLFWRKEDAAAVRQDAWKLIRLDDYDSVLYNLEEDLGETRDLSGTNPEKLSEMISLLESWEEELEEPRWHEGEGWIRVTRNIHEALMNNREPGRIAP